MRQVDVFSGKRPLVGAAEQEQCFGEVERSGVDGAEALVERAAVSRGPDDRSVGEYPHEDHPQGEQQGTCEHEEAGVAEGEFEANAQPRRPIHGLLAHARFLVER